MGNFIISEAWVDAVCSGLLRSLWLNRKNEDSTMQKSYNMILKR